MTGIFAAARPPWGGRRRRLTIGVVGIVMAASVSLAAARPYRHERWVAAALPPNDIIASMQIQGLVPVTPALRRGHYYVLHAVDRCGTELRVVADASFGDIVDLAPIYLPRFDAGPRIIRVPQRGEAGPGEPQRAVKIVRGLRPLCPPAEREAE